MTWIVPVFFLTACSLTFPSSGFVWGFSLSLILLMVCGEMGGTSSFFSLSNSWVLVDHLSFLMEALVIVVFVLSVSCSVKDLSLGGEGSFSGIDGVLSLVSFFSFFFFFFSGWMGFYFFFECSLIPTLWLILKWGYQPERVQAGLFMMLYTAGASLPLLVSLVWMYSLCGSDSFVLGKLSSESSSSVSTWIWGFILLGFFVKFPMYGLHVWLPKAHVEAPLAGSMVLAGVLLKLGGFGLIRMMWCLGMYVNEVLLLVISVSLWGGVISCFTAMVQCDMKALIAYSSVGHMSLVLASVLSCYPLGKVAGECMMFAHGVASPCMFAMAASCYDWTQSRSVSLNKGVLQAFPMFSLFWFVFAVANMGCPPSLNYFSEVMMFSALKELTMWLILPMGLMCYFSCIFNVLLYGYVNHGSVSFLLRAKNVLSERYLGSFMFSSVVLFLGFLQMDFFL